MDIPKSIFLLVTVVFLLALCLPGCSGSADPRSFCDRDQAGGEGPEGPVEEVIDIFAPEDGLYLSISLDSSSAVFHRGDEEIGSLKYDEIYYDLTDPDGDLIWKMMAHDTGVVVSCAESSPVLSISRGRDRVEFVDQGGKILFRIDEEESGVSLYYVSDDPDIPDELIATAISTADGISVSDADGNIRYFTHSMISPLGFVTVMLPGYDILERSALMIMVK